MSKWSAMTPLLRPVTNMNCSTPAARASSMTYCRMGRSTTGSISFGIALVAGKNRVPRPATGRIALRMGLNIRVKPFATICPARRPRKLATPSRPAVKPIDASFTPQRPTRGCDSCVNQSCYNDASPGGLRGENGGFGHRRGRLYRRSHESGATRRRREGGRARQSVDRLRLGGSGRRRNS